MKIVELKFYNEEDRKTARDIYLEILEQEGRVPGPDMSIVTSDEYAAKIRRRLDGAGVAYGVIE